jgi:hypothetical protein
MDECTYGHWGHPDDHLTSRSIMGSHAVTHVGAHTKISPGIELKIILVWKSTWDFGVSTNR